MKQINYCEANEYIINNLLTEVILARTQYSIGLPKPLLNSKQRDTKLMLALDQVKRCERNGDMNESRCRYWKDKIIEAMAEEVVIEFEYNKAHQVKRSIRSLCLKRTNNDNKN